MVASFVPMTDPSEELWGWSGSLGFWDLGASVKLGVFLKAGGIAAEIGIFYDTHRCIK